MSRDTDPASGAGSDTEMAVPDYSRGREFRHLALRAVILGIIGAAAGLIFLGVTDVGAQWYGDTGTGWFAGHPWWVAVAVAAGLIVGLLRRALAMPAQVPGLVEDLRSEQVDTTSVPKVVAVSAVSLVGGASLGPEVALGQIGGGAGTLLAKRGGADEDGTKEATLSGMAGAFGGLFSSPLMASILVLEISRPPTSRSGRTFYGTLVASATSFGLYFAIAGTVFLGLYQVPTYDYRDWHLLAGIGLGVFAALVVLISATIVLATKRLVSGIRIPPVVMPALGGLTFGIVGWALPLTNFTGSEQLATVLAQAGTLGTGLIVAILVGKMITFAASSATGFIGGPIFPMMFIGGTAGVLVHTVVPDIPLALAFSCMLAAVPGSLVAAPFSLVLLAAILTQVGAIQTAPIALAVATAFLTFTAVQSAIAKRRSTEAATAD